MGRHGNAVGDPYAACPLWRASKGDCAGWEPPLLGAVAMTTFAPLGSYARSFFFLDDPLLLRRAD